LGTYWEHIGNNKNPKNSAIHPPQNEKELGLLGACWLTSLAAKNFYGYLGSLRGMSKVLLLVKKISFVSFGNLFKCICLCEKV
jgi:hypothetical protein